MGTRRWGSPSSTRHQPINPASQHGFAATMVVASEKLTREESMSPLSSCIGLEGTKEAGQGGLYVYVKGWYMLSTLAFGVNGDD